MNWEFNDIRLAVEASYDGPRINEETNTIDLAFVKALVEHFKNQKKIHKKYAFMVSQVIIFVERKLFTNII
jgi:hypothetical protein